MLLFFTTNRRRDVTCNLIVNFAHVQGFLGTILTISNQKRGEIGLAHGNIYATEVS